VAVMNNMLNVDRNFPTWLTMSWAWQQSMDDPDKVRAAVASNLRRLRKKRGLTQKSLAKLSQASLISVEEIESASALPDISLIWELARALDVPCEAILGSSRND